MSLSLKVLGGFAVHDGTGASLALPTRKAGALLGYLAFHANQPQPRQKLTALFWSRSSEKQARHSLNQSLVAIRKLGGESGMPLITTKGDYVWLDDENIEIDVVHFRSLLDENSTDAAALYRGPLLEGLTSPDPAFDEWLIAARAELHNQACMALENAAKQSERQGRADAAIELTKKLISFEPLHEEGHRLLMRLLWQTGDRTGALRQYRVLADSLERELQVEPDMATRLLFENIRHNVGAPTKSNQTSAMPVASTSSNIPVIAVLPFDTFDGDAQTNNLANGLLEDLITALSKTRNLSVLPRHAVTIYKGQLANYRQAAAALAARYVLTGSVRISADRLRCSVQLIDASEGRHIWTERYDRPIDDTFAVLDEIVHQILIELQVHLTTGDSIRVASRGTRNLDAWLLYVQGHAEGNKFTREAVIRARELFEAAHRADPDWSGPLAMIAWTHLLEAQRDWSALREDSIRVGKDLCEQAIAMEPSNPLGYRTLNGFLFLLGDYEGGIAVAEKSAMLAPNDALTLASFAYKLFLVDEIDWALEVFERARRICPILPEYQIRRYGLLLQLAGQAERAVEILEGLTRSAPDFLYGHVQLAAAYAELGRLDAARSCIGTVLKQDPSFNTTLYLKTLPFKNRPRLEWLHGLLTETGLPE